MSRRSDIKTSIISLLETYSGFDAEHIHRQRYKPLFKAELPCICAYFPSEDRDNEFRRPRSSKPKLQVVFDVVNSLLDETELDEYFDTVADKIDQIVDNFPTLDLDYVEDWFVTNITLGEIPGTAGETFQGMKITTELVYIQELVPLADTDSLKRLYTDYDINQDDEADATDHINLTGG